MSAKPRIEEEEILRLYANGVRDFTGYKIWIGDIGPTNLSGVDFSRQDLSETLLEGFDLSGANLSGAILTSSLIRLAGAILRVNNSSANIASEIRDS